MRAMPFASIVMMLLSAPAAILLKILNVASLERSGAPLMHDAETLEDTFMGDESDFRAICWRHSDAYADWLVQG
jgi:hypothetical protein